MTTTATAARRKARVELAAVALACLMLAAPAFAAPGASSAFDAGVKSYRAGKYSQAVDHFLAARKRGMNNSNLDFNLGLAYYRAGKLPQARELLQRVRGDLRYTAVADYHLGLIAAKEGERDLAYYYLESVQALAPTDDMRNLASTELRRLDDVPLEAGPTTPDVEFPDASYYARLAAGFDSNPELESGTQDVVTDEGAGYADALANLEYPFLDTASGSTVFRADLHLRQHAGEDGYDQQSGDLGVRHYWGMGAWRLGTGVEGGAAWLDGEAYQSTGALVADGRRVFGANTATLRYEGLRVSGEGDYVYLDGWRHRAQAIVARSLGSLRARGDLAWELNERRDLTIGDEFSSYSPERRELGVAVQSPVLREYSLEVRGRYRTSDYDEPNRYEQDGVLLEQRRDDTLFATGARLRLRKAQDWNWVADYQFSRNESNIDAYDYERHVAALGVEWLR